MGIRIQTAIGWGMPIGDFLESLALPGISREMKDGWYDGFEAVVQNTRSMRGPKGMPLQITGPSETVLDLMRFIGYDEYSDVVLAPTMDAARRWFRTDDDIDYAFHVGTKGPGDYDLPGVKVDYLPYGFHPYADERMNADGSIANPPPASDYEGSFRWPRDRSLLPGVPRPMRHWLEASGVFEQTGIARLRPIRAMWWS